MRKTIWLLSIAVGLLGFSALIHAAGLGPGTGILAVIGG